MRDERRGSGERKEEEMRGVVCRSFPKSFVKNLLEAALSKKQPHHYLGIVPYC
jgi:hypothetical protein